jgi:transcription elongation factor/antiterminator RfaH
MENPDVSFASNLWYVVHCKPRKEYMAASILNCQLGLTVFLPEIEVRQRKEVRRVPFFPGYFFVKGDPWRIELKHINANPRVFKLLDFGDGPLMVPVALIEMLREEVERRSKYDQGSVRNLMVGDTVRITNGPFEGLSAVFVETLTSRERVNVLLNILGRLSKVQIDLDSLEKLQTDCPGEKSNPCSYQRRKTRGKGRKIHYR